MGRPRQRFQSACGDAPSDAFLAGAIQSAARSGRRGGERKNAVAFLLACRKRSPRFASILDGLRSIRKQTTLADYAQLIEVDRKSTPLNSSHQILSYAVF